MTMDPEHILFVCPALLEPGTTRGGGIEEIDFQVAKGVSTTSRVTIIGPYHGKFEKNHKIDQNLTFQYVRFPAHGNYPPRDTAELYRTVFIAAPIYAILFSIKLIHFMFSEHPSIIVVHNGLPGLISTIIGRVMGKCIIYSEGNLTPWTDPHLCAVKRSFSQNSMLKIHHGMGTTIARFSNRIRVQSPSIESGMVDSGVPAGKISIIEGGVDLDCFYPILPSESHEPMVNVAFIGRLTEEKGIGLLLEIVKTASKAMPELRFFLFGDGEFRKHFSDCSNVQHTGPVPKQDLNRWLAKIDIVVFFQKELGLAEVESLAAGKCILVSNKEAIRSVIQQRENGVLCEPNAQSYLAAIRSLIEDPPLMEQISPSARMTACELFAWPVVINKWIDLFSRCGGTD